MLSSERASWIVLDQNNVLQVNGQLDLLHSLTVTGTAQDDIDALTTNAAFIALRDANAADIVLVFTGGDYPNSNIAGIAGGFVDSDRSNARVCNLISLASGVFSKLSHHAFSDSVTVVAHVLTPPLVELRSADLAHCLLHEVDGYLAVVQGDG
jgi:hypothetical protein